MSAHQPDSRGDLLVLAGRIHTCSPAGAVEALLLRNGRVAAAGHAADLRRPGLRTLDFTGCTITPGLVDAHVHLTEWAFARREVDLSGAATPTEAARIAATAPGQGWIRGRGWNPHLWQDQPPHRAILDAVTTRPVALQSHDMHSLWVNTAALSAAGVTASTPDPDGGTIVRDPSGEPTGLLREWAGPLVTRHIPAPSLDEAVDAVRDARRELHSLGITGVHSFPAIHLLEPAAETVIRALYDRESLCLRVLQHIPLGDLDGAVAAGRRSGDGDEWLRTGALKMFLDGALGSRTAWMLDPYEGEASRGMQVLDEEEFRGHVRRAADNGIASTVHAIGDAAVSLALDVLAAPDTRVPAMPHRIEHLQCCPPGRLGDAAHAGIIASMQPSHMITDWSIAERHWGSARSQRAFALASLLRHGTIMAFGSDVPVEPVDPRRGFHAAVRRQDLRGDPAGGWFKDECISAHDALLGYTVGAARAAGLPDPAGSLAPGAPADLAVWDRDPCAHDDLLNMQCVAVLVGGELIPSGNMEK